MSETINGQCHCGNVSVTVPEAAMFTFACHCDDCRKLSSGGRLLGHGISSDDLTVDGRLNTYAYPGGSGKDIIMHFCPKCSTQIYAEPTSHPGMAAVRVGILENEDVFIPMQHLHTDGAYPWENAE